MYISALAGVIALVFGLVTNLTVSGIKQKISILYQVFYLFLLIIAILEKEFFRVDRISQSITFWELAIYYYFIVGFVFLFYECQINFSPKIADHLGIIYKNPQDLVAAMLP